jgi:hypothetical protein
VAIAGGPPDDLLPGTPKDIESMKRDARILTAALSRSGAAFGVAMATDPKAPDSSAMIDAAVRQAFAQAGRQFTARGVKAGPQAATRRVHRAADRNAVVVECRARCLVGR